MSGIADQCAMLWSDEPCAADAGKLTEYRGVKYCQFHLERKQAQVARAKDRRDREAPRREVTGREIRILTYNVYATLACGHVTSYTVPGARIRDDKAHPKTIRCYECGRNRA